MHTHDHTHTHGAVDSVLFTTKRGMWAVKWSFIGLMATTIFQIIIVYISDSVALLADTIHNFADALTAIPLGIAFLFARKAANKQFTYGYGRVEDLAGLIVVLSVFVSAMVAGYESIYRFFYPQEIQYIGTIVIAALISFFGNEAVAIFRIKVGKEIGSAALIADGYHSRADGFISLGVIASAVGVWLGYPLADPIVGLIMTGLILKIVWEAAISIITRILDGVEPGVVDQIQETAQKVKGIIEVTEIRVRWLGHRLHTELNITVNQNISVEEGHRIADEVRHELFHELEFLSNIIIHIDPATASGEKFHLSPIIKKK